jgi:hypothetical protein
MSDDARERLAAAQAEVVRALVAGGEIPTGFDPIHIINARHVLADKSVRIASRRARGAPMLAPRSLWQRLAARVVRRRCTSSR